MRTRLPTELFGEALMVLEFLRAFGEAFDLTDEFPDGVSLGEITGHTSCCLWFQSRSVLCRGPGGQIHKLICAASSEISGSRELRFYSPMLSLL